MPIIGPELEFKAQVDAIASLTDNSGGSAGDTLAEITGSYVEATMENTVASLAAKINAILAALRSAGILIE
jgi:hypothetical protein